MVRWPTGWCFWMGFLSFPHLQTISDENPSGGGGCGSNLEVGSDRPKEQNWNRKGFLIASVKIWSWGHWVRKGPGGPINRLLRGLKTRTSALISGSVIIFNMFFFQVSFQDVMALFVCNLLNDDDCFHYHSWRNNAVIAFGTLLSFFSCWNPATPSSVGFEQIEHVNRLLNYHIKGKKVWGTVYRDSLWGFAESEFQTQKNKQR